MTTMGSRPSLAFCDAALPGYTGSFCFAFTFLVKFSSITGVFCPYLSVRSFFTLMFCLREGYTIYFTPFHWK